MFSKHRAATDLEHHQQEKKRLRSALEQIQRELAQDQLKQCDLQKLNNLLNNKLKSEKEEVRIIYDFLTFWVILTCTALLIALMTTVVST